MTKPFKLTNPIGQAIYVGADWVIRPAPYPEDGMTEVVYQRTVQIVRESVEEIVAKIEAGESGD